MEGSNAENNLGAKNANIDFDWKTYLKLNFDLVENGIVTKEAAFAHFLDYGIDEGRVHYELSDINCFVFCGAKSGSQTLWKSLYYSGLKCIHLNSNEHFMESQNAYDSVFKLIENNAKRMEKIYIIDVYRNPIERKISSLFFNHFSRFENLSLDKLIETFNTNYIEDENTLIIQCKKGYHIIISELLNKIEGVKIDEIHQTYIRANMKTFENLEKTLNVFNKNKETLGILNYTNKNINIHEYCQPIEEIFRHFDISENFLEYNKEKKCGVYEYNNIVFIKLRFLDIDEWDKILSNVIDNKIKLVPFGLTKDKPYFGTFTEFKCKYRVPRKFLKTLHKDDHFNAFNSAKEKNDYFKSWLNRSVD
jgi:hypothetical protein